MASKMEPPKKKTKPRLPLPIKPPKVEPKPTAYDRKQKHKRDWLESDDNAKPVEEDK